MSDVKRWKETESWGFTEGDCMAVMRECNDGEYVLYSDYARLKAEVERLRASSFVTAVPVEQYEKLKAEVEAYRSASDEVAAAFLALPTPHNQVARVCEGIESLKAEVERLEPELEQRCRELNLSLGQQAVQLRQIGDLKAQLEHIDLLKSVVEKFINSADLKNPLDTQSHCAITEKLKQLPDCILDFTEEQVRDNPAWALAVFRHKVKEMQYKRVHDLNAIGGEQEENARLKAEVERLRKAGDKLAGGRTHTFTIHGLLIPDPDVVAWNAAKEGKQP